MVIPKLAMSLNVFVPLLVIAIFSVYSFALSINTTAVQSQTGVFFNASAGGFTVASNGFAVVQSSSAATTLPVTWVNDGSCQTALAAGDWQYSVTLTITASAAANHTYTLTVSWNTGSGYANMCTALTFTTLATIVAGQSVTFVLDTGSTTFGALVGINIIVQ